MAAATGASIFPLPAIDMPPMSNSRSRRLQARTRSVCSVTTIANDAISGLNSLYFSYRPPQNRSSTSRPHSAAQSRVAAHIYSSAQRFFKRRQAASQHAASSDDSIATMILQDHLSTQASASYSSTVTAVPLVADRVALPSSAGAVDLLAALPPSVASAYRCPSPLSLRELAERKSQVKPRVFATRPEYIKLVHRLVAHSMVEFTKSPVVINGLFGVEKPDGSIRLIVDGRPANQTFVEPPRVQLPTPDLVPRLMVPPNKKLYVAKSDLADFFYRFRVPVWMQPYFALPGLTAEELDLVSTFGSGAIVYPCLSVLAMGWSHSVYLAQTAHEHLLNTRTRLQPCDRITHSSDLLVNRTRHLVYIDDLIMFGTDPEEMSAVQAHYVAVTAALNLPAKPSKVIPPSADGVDCLGVELTGSDQVLAPRADKLERLRQDTIALLRRGSCSGRDLAALVGRWTWIMLVTRPGLACFAAVYRFMQCAGRRVFRLWGTVARELYIVTCLSPLFLTSLSSAWYPQVFATDASSDGQGVVAAQVPSEIVEVAARQSGSVNPKSAESLAVDQLVVNRSWSVIVSSRWRAPEHINALEVRAVSTAVRHVLSSPLSFDRRRLLVLCDSQVAVGALAKGRSSSHPLLCRLRPVSALLLASGLQLYLRWIASAMNPADGPSRGAAVF